MSTEAAEAPRKIGGREIVGIACGVMLLWICTPLVFALLYSDIPTRGQIGDLFGSINALFSGLAFAGVIVAILLQRTELFYQRQQLELQREELILTRNELKRSADAHEAAQKVLNSTLYAQSFKVALDILEARSVVDARYALVELCSTKGTDPTQWTTVDNLVAEIVSRTFDSVGTMIRKRMLPPEYLTDSWSGTITRSWSLLQRYIEKLRVDRSDRYIGQDFEWLAREAERFLSAENNSKIG